MTNEHDRTTGGRLTGDDAAPLAFGDRRSAEKVFFVFLLVLAGAAAGLLFAMREATAPATVIIDKAAAGDDAAPADVEAVNEPTPAQTRTQGGARETAALESAAVEKRRVRVRRGDTLINALRREGLDYQTAHDAATALGQVFRLSRLRAGQEIELVMAPPAVSVFQDAIRAERGASAPLELIALKFQPDVARRVGLRLGLDQSFESFVNEVPLIKRPTIASDEIDSSLYVAAMRSGMPDAAINDFINIFAWDVDFQREIRKGDAFEAFYSVHYDDTGAAVRADDIVYASMTLSGKKKEFYRFKTPDDGKIDYFDAAGRSAKKFLMKTPVDGARISSSYGKRRHPILGYSKMHKGVDFAAPTGTPIKAAGDGVIEKSRRNGSFGHFVRIRHANGYKTQYAHLSGYGAGVKEGRRVRQGQIIGYVGATGRVTGPHLHYEVLRNGAHVNPLRLRVATGRSLDGDILAAFQTARAEIDGERATAAPDGSPGAIVAASTAAIVGGR